MIGSTHCIQTSSIVQTNENQSLSLLDHLYGNDERTDELKLISTAITCLEIHNGEMVEQWK